MNIELLKKDLETNNLLNNISLIIDNKNFRFIEKIKKYKNNNDINTIHLNNLMINYINIYKVIENLLFNCSNIYLDLDLKNYYIFNHNLYKENDLIKYITSYIIYEYENNFNSINLNKYSFLVIEKKDLKNFIKENKTYGFSYNDITIKSNNYYLLINIYENFNINILKYNKINFKNHNIHIDLLNNKVYIHKKDLYI